MTTLNIEVPSYWAMFTTAGDRSIQKKAQSFLVKMSTAKGLERKVAISCSFLKSYRKMANTKNYPEAGDTTVRECVWDFFERVCKAVGVSSAVADDIWELRNAYPA